MNFMWGVYIVGCVCDRSFVVEVPLYLFVLLVLYGRCKLLIGGDSVGNLWLLKFLEKPQLPVFEEGR